MFIAGYCLNVSFNGSLADPVGGCGACNPPYFSKKNSGHPRGRCDRFTRVAVVVDLVVTSSNNACLCALNGVTV